MGRYVVEDEAGASGPGVLQRAGNWIADTFGPNGNLRGSSIGGVMQGMANPVVGAVQLGAHALGLGDKIDPAIAAKEQEYQQARKAAGREGFDAAQMIGEVASPVNLVLGALGRAASGASLGSRVGAGAGAGAVSGLMFPVTSPEDQANYWTTKGQQTAVGAGVGGAVPAAFAGAARVLSPKASTNPDVRMLLDGGVRLTPGQVLGGIPARVEEKSRSLFGLGDAISSSFNRAERDLNTMVLNKGLELVGPMVGLPTKALAPGHAGIAQLRDTAQLAYNKLVPHLTADLNDTQFYANVQLLRQHVAQMPKEYSDAFDYIVNRELGSRMGPNGQLQGELLQDAVRSLRDEGSRYSRSSSAFENDLGEALKALQSEIKDLLERTNPQFSDEFRRINTAWRILSAAREASKSVAAPEGVFNPAQFHSAVRAQDITKGKRAFSEGDAFLQDLSGPAKTILASHPDSGLTGRLAATAGALASGFAQPAIPLSLLASSAAYAPWIQDKIVKGIVNRPAAAGPLADLLRRGGVYAAPGVAGHVADR